MVRSKPVNAFQVKEALPNAAIFDFTQSIAKVRFCVDKWFSAPWWQRQVDDLKEVLTELYSLSKLFAEEP